MPLKTNGHRTQKCERFLTLPIYLVAGFSPAVTCIAMRPRTLIAKTPVKTVTKKSGLIPKRLDNIWLKLKSHTIPINSVLRFRGLAVNTAYVKKSRHAS